MASGAWGLRPHPQNSPSLRILATRLANFVASLENLKDIAKQSDSIGMHLINILRWFNFFKQKHIDFLACSSHQRLMLIAQDAQVHR